MEAGDYILPSELGNGFGKAVHPDEMNTRDYKKIAGVAWSVIGSLVDNVSIVNVAVGINTNDLSGVVNQQEEELSNLREEYDKLRLQVEQSNAVLSDLVPGYAQALGINNSSKTQNTNTILSSVDNSFDEQELVHSDEDDVIYFEISKEQIETSFDMAREQYQSMLDDAGQIEKLFLSNKNKTSTGTGVLQHDDQLINHDNTPLITCFFTSSGFDGIGLS